MGDSLGAESERFQPTRGHRRMISVASDKGVVEEKALQSALCARCGILQYYAEGYKQPACLHCAVRTLTAFFASSSAMQSVSSLGNTSPPVLLQTSPSPSSCSGAPSPRNGAQSFRNGAPPSRNGDPPSYAGASSSIRSQVQGGDQAAEVDGDSTTVPKARKSQANVYPPGTREITVVDWLCRKTAELKKEKKKARGSSMEAQK